MASEKSLYRKIQETLETTRSVDVSSIHELREAIEKREPHVFQTFQYDAERDEMTTRVSARVIRQTVNMCSVLGSIDTTGSLTEAGREALRKNKYNEVLAERVTALLRQQGVKVSALNQAIARCLEARPPVLPTTREIWSAAANGFPLGRFAKLLTLLAHCGYAKHSQQRLYLHVGR